MPDNAYKIGWKFDNTYSKLPKNLFSELKPSPVKTPEVIVFNEKLSNEIGLDFSKVNKEDLASIFSGNFLPKKTNTIAQAYAGHQFGYFTILGDGRAIILGEHITKENKRVDIQLKGCGKTPYSRNADGRAALGPMLREYIISESMNSLGIPTSRSLAVIKTGESVLREKILPGAILTRVASSHIRVGTFQFALISKDKNDLKYLFDYTLDRHYPHIKNTKFPALEFLRIVMRKQINLVCNWIRVGFVHGVMNTDNMTISGETIDYGPCAFIGNYDPNTVFSSIDLQGRYSFLNQPNIVKWNLERFAETLLPLIDEDNKKAIKGAEEVLAEFDGEFKKTWFTMMKRKFGLIGEEKHDEKIITDFFSWMYKKKVDYTNTFCHLMNSLRKKNKIYDSEEFKNLKKNWENRVNFNSESETSLRIMKEVNPLVIPRNHIVENAIKEAEANNNLEKFKNLMRVLENPYINNDEDESYQSTSENSKKYITYCGT